MSPAKLTVLVVVGLLAAAAGGVWWKIPAWKAELLDGQDQVVGELIAQMQAEAGRAAPAEAPGAPVAPQTQAGDVPVAAFVDDDVEAARAGRRVLYQYTDASGRVRFVPSLRDVPADQRARAGRLEVAGRSEPAPSLRHLAPERPAPAPAAPAPAPGPAAAAPSVRVYVMSFACGDCGRVTQWLDARGVAYREIDAMANPAALQPLIAKTRRTKLSLPVFEYGSHVIEGFRPAEMAEALGIE